MLSQQLVKGGIEFTLKIDSQLDSHEVHTVSALRNEGRRVQDTHDLNQKIHAEDAKASRLTRTHLTIESLEEEASHTKPTNDNTFTFDDTVIIWRKKVEKLSTVAFWDKLHLKEDYKKMWKQARATMIFLGSMSVKRKTRKVLSPLHPPWKAHCKRVNWGDKMKHNFNWGKTGCYLYSANSIYSTVTSHTKAKTFILAYLSQIKFISKHMYSYLWFNGDGLGFDDKSARKDDIMFLFVRHVESAFLDDNIEPAEMALVERCRETNPHYKYTIEMEDGCNSDSDRDDTEIMCSDENEPNNE